MRLARHLDTVVQIVYRVENRIVVGDVLDRPVRKHELDALFELVPFVDAVKIVGHEESAAQQILAHDAASSSFNPHSPTCTAYSHGQL